MLSRRLIRRGESEINLDYASLGGGGAAKTICWAYGVVANNGACRRKGI